MNAPAKSRYGFGQVQNWLEDEPAAPTPAETDRQAFIRKTQEAAASVGYVAPSELPKAIPTVAVPPEPVAEITAPKAPKPVRTKSSAKIEPIVEPEGKKGRPKGERTVQMSVRIRQEHEDLIKAIAQDDFSVASIVESALVAFAKGLYHDKRYKRMPLDEKTLALAKSIFSEKLK
jgi:hypothetical protein